MNARVIIIVSVFCIALVGCERRNPLTPDATVDPDRVIPETSATLQETLEPVGAVHVEGVIGPGAVYSMDRPADWNGDLVIWVHGYTPACAPVALPNVASLRDALLAQGFGVAYSSFSENGYALAEGARQTHQLSGVWTSRLGRPNRTFLMGASLGGIIGLKLIETHPEAYAGALLVSGVVGGTKAEIQYIGDTRVLFDCLYPSVLPGGLFDTPTCGTPFPTADVVAAIQQNPDGLAALLCLNPNLPYANSTEAITSAVTALSFQWVGAVDLFDRTHQHSLYDNDDAVYTCPLLPPALVAGVNACVERYVATPDAQAFLRMNYEPSGNLRAPVLTLHNLRDPVVPAFHETLYREKVTRAGRLGFLLQRTKDSYGHVDFTGAELLGAFAELVSWVSTGEKPPA